MSLTTLATFRPDQQSTVDDAAAFRGLLSLCSCTRWVVYSRIRDDVNGYLPLAVSITRGPQCPALGQTVQVRHVLSKAQGHTVEMTCAITSLDGATVYANAWLLSYVYKLGPASKYEFRGPGVFGFAHLVQDNLVSKDAPPPPPPVRLDAQAHTCKVHFRVSDQDQMGHVNGLRYVDAIVHAMARVAPPARRFASLSLVYAKQCFASDDVDLALAVNAEGVDAILSVAGDVRTRAAARFAPEGWRAAAPWDPRVLQLAAHAQAAAPLNRYSGGGKMVQRRYLVEFADTSGYGNEYVSTIFRHAVAVVQHVLLIVRKPAVEAVVFSPSRFSVHLSARPTGHTLVCVRAWVTTLSTSAIECGISVSKSRTGQALASGMLALSCRDALSLKRTAVAWHRIARDFHGPKFAPVVSAQSAAARAPQAAAAAKEPFKAQVRPSDLGVDGALDIAGLANLVCAARGALPPATDSNDDEQWRMEMLADVRAGTWLTVEATQQGPATAAYQVRTVDSDAVVARAWVLARLAKLPELEFDVHVGGVTEDEPLEVVVVSR